MLQAGHGSVKLLAVFSAQARPSMDFTPAQILWPGLLDGQNKVLYSVVGGAIDQVLCSGMSTGPQVLRGLFGDSNQEGLCPEIPSQRDTCFCVQTSRTIWYRWCSLFKCHCKAGLMDRTGNLLCTLIRVSCKERRNSELDGAGQIVEKVRCLLCTRPNTVL